MELDHQEALCHEYYQPFKDCLNIVTIHKEGIISDFAQLLLNQHRGLQALQASTTEDCVLCSKFLEDISSRISRVSSETLDKLNAKRGKISLSPGGTSYTFKIEDIEVWLLKPRFSSCI